MNTHELLLYVHVVGAIGWLGGAAFANVMGTRILKAGTPEEGAAFGRQLGWIGERYFTPLSVLVLLSGVGMVLRSPVYSFGDPWITAGFTGIVTTIVIGSGFLGPQAKKMGRLIGERGPADPEVRAVTSRLLLIARIDLLILFVVVAMMVFKPGV